MKKIAIISVILIVLVVGFWYYKTQVPPKFSVDKIGGYFTFGKEKKDFSTSFIKGLTGPSGWMVAAVPSEDGKTIVFKLYKNTVYKKDLQTINF